MQKEQWIIPQLLQLNWGRTGIINRTTCFSSPAFLPKQNPLIVIPEDVRHAGCLRPIISGSITILISFLFPWSGWKRERRFWCVKDVNKPRARWMRAMTPCRKDKLTGVIIVGEQWKKILHTVLTAADISNQKSWRFLKGSRSQGLQDSSEKALKTDQ